jgi:hypothetical protein
VASWNTTPYGLVDKVKGGTQNFGRTSCLQLQGTNEWGGEVASLYRQVANKLVL